MGTFADWIRAKFPLRSLANPTNSDIQKAFLGIDDNGNYLGDGRVVTGSADGTGTGAVLSFEDGFLTVTSANADHILMLPDAPAETIGKVIEGWVGATAVEVRSAGTASTINGLDCKTTNELALPATGRFRFQVCAAQTWLCSYDTELGARVTLVPDAVA